MYDLRGPTSSRPRMRPRGWRALIVVALVVGLPILEIWLLVLLGRQIGLLPVLLLVFAGIAVGSWLIRRRWRSAWNSLLQAGRSGDPLAGAGDGKDASRQMADTAVFVAGGAALMFPGLITDLVGLICLIPLTRALPRGLLQRYVDRRVQEVTAMAQMSGFTRPAPRYGADGDVIHGEVVDDDSTAESPSPDRGTASGSDRSQRSPLIISADPEDDRRS